MIKRWLADRIFRRMLKNISWLLLGRVITGLAGLVYLSLITHHLGAETFGTLILVQTYIQTIIILTTFRSSQAVIRYGTVCLETQDKRGFHNLLKFTTLLDILGVIIGFLVAWFCAPILGFYLGWMPDLIAQVQLCSIAILFAVKSTPEGLLRLYNRFDLLAFQLVVLPIICLLGTIIAVMVEAPFWGYLLVWFIANVFDGLLLMGTGLYEAINQGAMETMDSSIANLTKEHPGLWKFCLASNLDSSLPTIMRQATPIVIGLISTPTAVGLFRIGYELSTPLKDLAELFAHPLYPELARFSHQQKVNKFRELIIKTSKVSTGVGVLMFLTFTLVGKTILSYGFGDEFKAAYGISLLLVGAEVLTMANCSLEPALYALGYPSLSLKVNGITIVFIYFPLLILLTHAFGFIGAGVATLAATCLIFILNGAATWLQLKKEIV